MSSLHRHRRCAAVSLRVRVWIASLVAIFAVLIATRGLARADQTTAHTASVVVLSFDSDDAEEQADAMTGALRSRVRASQAWSLVETTQSLGMLTAALRCPGKPVPADCQGRIADQIKSDRFIYGYVTKGPPGQVTAEVHLFQRNKPDSVAKESYTENLKDSNDDFLRKVAQKLLDKISSGAIGVLVAHSGTDNGEVIVDGEKHFPMQNGTSRLELSPGLHSVELAVAGRPPNKRNVVVNAGKEASIDLAPAPPAAEPPRGSEKQFPTRKVVGAGLAALGIAGVAFGVVNFTAYLDDQKRGQDHENGPTNNADPKLPPGKTADDVCGKRVDGIEYRDTYTICKTNADANRHSLITWVSGAAGIVALGAGAYLFLTEEGGEEAKKKGSASRKRRLAAVPSIGPEGGSLVVSGSF
jgi:hypothetical protein